MSFRSRHFAAVMLGISALLVGMSMFARGQESSPPATEAPAKAEKEEAEKAKAKETDKAEAGDTKKSEQREDLYAVPEDDTAALVEFINDLIEFEPSSREEAEAHEKQLIPALRTAAERIQKIEKEGSDAAMLAKRVLFQVRIVELPKASEKDAEQLYADLEKHFAHLPNAKVIDYGIAVQFARGLELNDHPQAAKAYEHFGALLAKHSNEAIATRGEMMLGSARRLALVGQPMKVAGTTVDGKAFDVKDFQGKVVLVDFWATWCAPCRAELPKIKAHYAKYHDKGFEVVGINLDQDRTAMEDFLKEMKVPWITLREEGGEGEHPVARHYGVEAIPFMALIGRDGKVISIEAYGEALANLLAEQFPE